MWSLFRLTSELLPTLSGAGQPSAFLPACKRYSSFFIQDAHRLSRTVLSGFMEGDEGILKTDGSDLAALKQRKDDVLKTGDPQKFHQLVFDAQKCFERLRPKSAFALDPYLAFNGPLSPLHEHYKKIYHLLFGKVLQHKNHVNRIVANHSGFYFTGGRGVGKTTMLRLCAITMAQLFPEDVLTVYVDYEAQADPSSLTPCQLIREAMQHHPKLASFKTTHMDRIDQLLAVAEKENVLIALFVDELQSVYRKDFWAEFHTLVTSLKHALFVTGSDAYLPLMVCAEPGHKKYLQKHGFEPLSSLNDTKLRRSHVQPLHHPSQYLTYFTNRPHLLKKTFPENPASVDCENPSQEVMDRINQIHLLCGGKLRGLQITDLSPGNLPDVPLDPVEAKLLRKMGRNWINGGLDPFVTQVISTKEFTKMLEEVELEHFKEQNERARKMGVEPHARAPPKDQLSVITNLVESKWLTTLLNGQHQIAQPILNFHILGWMPNIFVSHAFADYSAIREPLHELGKDTDVTFSACETDSAKESMSASSIEKWMTEQVKSRTEDVVGHFILAVLSPAYLSRLEDSKSGVFYEWREIKKLLKDPDDQKHVILVSYGLQGEDFKRLDPLFDMPKPYIYNLFEDQPALRSKLRHLSRPRKLPNHQELSETGRFRLLDSQITVLKQPANKSAQ